MNRNASRKVEEAVVECLNVVGPGETLIADNRGRLRPYQIVESKLASLSKSNPLPLSFLSRGKARRPKRAHS